MNTLHCYVLKQPFILVNVKGDNYGSKSNVQSSSIHIRSGYIFQAFKKTLKSMERFLKIFIERFSTENLQSENEDKRS